MTWTLFSLWAFSSFNSCTDKETHCCKLLFRKIRFLMWPTISQLKSKQFYRPKVCPEWRRHSNSFKVRLTITFAFFLRKLTSLPFVRLVIHVSFLLLFLYWSFHPLTCAKKFWIGWFLHLFLENFQFALQFLLSQEVWIQEVMSKKQTFLFDVIF